MHFDLTPELVASLGAAATAVMGSAFGFTKWLLTWIKQVVADRRSAREHVLTVEGLRAFQELYEAIQVIRDHGVERVLVFVGHNSGGIPRPGSPFFVSALHWSVDGAHQEYPARYQNLPVDAQMVQTLVAMRDNGEVRATTEKLKPCQLKNYYEAEGVTDSLLLPLGISEKKLYFLSAGSYYGNLSNKQVTEIQLQANRIRNILKTK